MSNQLGTVQTGTGKVDPARKFKCTTAARGKSRGLSLSLRLSSFSNSSSVSDQEVLFLVMVQLLSGVTILEVHLLLLDIHIGTRIIRHNLLVDFIMCKYYKT